MRTHSYLVCTRYISSKTRAGSGPPSVWLSLYSYLPRMSNTHYSQTVSLTSPGSLSRCTDSGGSLWGIFSRTADSPGPGVPGPASAVPATGPSAVSRHKQWPVWIKHHRGRATNANAPVMESIVNCGSVYHPIIWLFHSIRKTDCHQGSPTGYILERHAGLVTVLSHQVMQQLSYILFDY